MIRTSKPARPQRTIKNLHRRSFEIRAGGMTEDGGIWVEGRAATFDSPTVLFEWDGVEYSEQIASGAFDGCYMGDVIFNYNHGGHVLARTRNRTLSLEVKDDGLYMRARLDGTEEGRKIYEEVTGGYIDRMSFAFTIREEAFDQTTRTWTVQKVKRLYDVSAVDIPAYDDTSIEARRADAERMALEHRNADAGREGLEHRGVADAMALLRRVRIRTKLALFLAKERRIPHEKAKSAP
ncbi:MAG: HK97 family phage prohead protease [Clostridiales bacterium]|nr:HK97 family phage prohead protease [Clostridiales bacterium]